MIADHIRASAEAGLAGMVIGASDPDRRLVAATLARWITYANNRSGAHRRRASRKLAEILKRSA